MQEPEFTADKLLNSAEKLYASSGIAGTSLRKIIADAGVNIAAVHYHFGSKDQLTKAVFQRRIRGVNQQRLELLENLKKTFGESPIPVKDLLRAFLAPVISLGQDKQGGNFFFRIVARAHAETDPIVQQVLLEELQDIIRIFLQELTKSLPGLDKKTAALRLAFSAGSMMQAVLLPENPTFVEAFFNEKPEPASILDELISFVSAGFISDTTTNGNNDV